MTGILLSKGFVAQFGALLRERAKEAAREVQAIHFADDAQVRLSPEQLARIEVAYLTRDFRFGEYYVPFGDTMKAAPNLKWVHFASTGIDQHPFLPSLIERGVKLTSSAGTNGEPVGHTAICGMLMLARRFPRWLGAQRRRRWEPTPGDDAPPDLRGQTVVIVGLGAIGGTVARFCQALGMRVLGVRRSPREAGDPVDVMHTLPEFRQLLPRCDWLVLACPLTDETRHLLDSKSVSLLPRGAHVINVARGGVADEAALVEALRSGHLAGAYLDVFAVEPLAAESPLWDMPNVICTPHNASAASGNDRRAAEVFATNFVRWARGEAMVNERQA